MRAVQGENLPRPPDTMADSMSYSTTSHYMPPPYYPTPHGTSHGHVHVVAPPPRPEAAQRKRPKYTRSKTGCLTCRVKKIKCDETKPNCMRCTHGQRDCTWPEGVPARKKSTSKKETVDGRPSTAESSGLSEASTPPTRDHTPPRRAAADLGLPPLASRRHSEPYSQLNPIGPEADSGRRQSTASAERGSPAHGYPMHHSNSNSNVLSMIPEISSYPTHPRYDHGYTSSMHSSAHSTASNRVPTSHSVATSLRSVGQHQSVNQWNPPIMAPIDPIEPFFHSVQERNLIRHYCDNSLSIIVAAPSETSFYTGNPVVAANLPLVLQPPGSDPSAEALRLGLLGVAAIHQSFLLARSGLTQHAADEMLQLAHSFRMNSKQQLAKSCTTVEGTQSDATLAASIAIALMDIFSGGRNWSRNMDLAKTLVNVRGGPATLLARSAASKPDAIEGISRARLLLEILSVYDIFGCLGTGKEPTLMNSSADPWWLDESHASYSYVEQVFGMSHTFIPLLARVVSFVSRAINQSAHITEVVGDTPDQDEPDYTKECHELYNLLENWSHSSGDVSPRVHTGNRIYQKTAQIVLLRDVLNVSPADSLVQQCCDTVLTLCSECSASKMGVDLIWPVIIAGSHMFGSDRNRVTDIFEAFRTQCCYEIDTSEQIVLQVWKRLDQGHLKAEWRSVMRDFDLSVLIL